MEFRPTFSGEKQVPRQPKKPHLVFVYNADDGLFNTLADIGHKLFSPATYPCGLCMITHGNFREKAQWRAVLETLPATCEFLHRNQFRTRYPASREPLPAIFVKTGNRLRPCIRASQLRACDHPERLGELIRLHCLCVSSTGGSR